MALNWKGGASGAVSGATAGSTFGPIGTGVGAVGGALLGLLSRGRKDKMKNISSQLPEQRQSLLDILSQLQGMQGMQGPEGTYGMSQDYLKNLLGGSQENFNKFAQPYQTHFNEQVLPGIAERFAGLGGGMGGGILGSSGFAQALGGAGSQFSSGLAQLYAMLQNQAAQSAMGQYNTLLANFGLNNQAFQPHYQQGNLGLVGEASKNFLGSAAKSFGENAGKNLSDKIKEWMK